MASRYNWLTVPLQYGSLEDGGQRSLQILLPGSGAVSDLIQKGWHPQLLEMQA